MITLSMSAQKYINWNLPDWENGKYLDKEDVKTCHDNIAYIQETVEIMTQDEVEAFITYDYVTDMALATTTL